MSIRPLRLVGPSGPLLALYYPPLGSPAACGDILYAPPFGEEMNRCRSMVSMQARLLAAQGIGTLIVDPYGMGDSDGKHAEGTWSKWRDDLRCGIDWLRSSGNGCRTIWGVRLGAIMAGELAAADHGIDRLLLWLPVLQGKTFYTQFLRIRVAAELEQHDGVKSTEELRKWSRNGATIEVSGYHINSTLARELDEVRFREAEQLRHCRLLWCEVVASEDAPVPQNNRKAIDAYKSAGVAVDFERVIGPAFWHVHERAVAPELLNATTRLLTTASQDSMAAAPRVDRNEKSDAKNSAQTAAGVQAEYSLVFPCEREELVGVVHRSHAAARRGVVVVVAGGPQYRAGAHRQFVSLARELVAGGHPVLRFDLRGMGDSSGAHLGFQQSNADIRAAVDALLVQQPQLEEIVLFGECESASGILFYAFQDPRVKGIALVNPWVRTQEGRARVIIKHYYLGRLLSRDFWQKVRSGKFNPFEALRSFAGVLRAYWAGLQAAGEQRGPATKYADIAALPLPAKTAAGLQGFPGAVLILTSGRDYIAREFDEVVKESKAWQSMLNDPRVKRVDLLEADHTFSRDVWRIQATDAVRDWLRGW